MTSDRSTGDEPFEPATLIIPTRDRPGLLAASLRSVLDAELVPDEILVVDQSTTCDGTVERQAAAADHPIRHIHESSAGVSRGRNVGARLAMHEVLLFIDDDVLVERGWCRVIRVALAAAPDQAVVTGRLEATEPEQPGAFAPSTTANFSRHTYTEPIGIDVLYSGNMAMRRLTLRTVGGFDVRLGPGTSYPAAEDNDLAHRLLTSGVAIVSEPDALAHHRAWRPASALLPLRWRYGRGQGAFLAKHLTDQRGSTGPRLGSQIVRYARRIARAGRERPAAALPDLAYLLGLVIGAVQWILCERVPRRVLVVPDDPSHRE